jgi:hypothetical protein
MPLNIVKGIVIYSNALSEVFLPSKAVGNIVVDGYKLACVEN